MTSEDQRRRRVVVLAGPSGAGKSRLAARLHERHDWPIVRLDDFYRDVDDPALPLDVDLGIPDWDDPASWKADASLAALRELVDVGTTTTPDYDIATSRACGSSLVTARPTDLILTEGIFAAELIRPLDSAGLLHSAWCIVHRNRWSTFAWRLGRDLREHRKPPLILIRRGWGLLRSQPAMVARQRELGARSATAVSVEAFLQGHVAGLD